MTEFEAKPTIGGMLGTSSFSPESSWRTVGIGLAAVALGVGLAVAPLGWGAVALATAAAAPFLLSRTHLILPLLAFAVPFGSLWEIRVGVISVGATEAILGAALLIWVAGLAAQRRGPRTPPLLTLILMFWAVLALSVLVSGDLALSVKGLLVWLEVVLVYWMAHDLLNLRSARILAGAVVIAAALEAGLGLIQFVGGIGAEAFALPGGLSRASGTFGQPNPYGGYLAIALPIGLAPFFGSPHRWSRRVVLSALAAAGVIAAGILASWSRGAWLGAGAATLAVAVAGGMIGGWNRIRGVAVVAAVVALVGLAVAVGGPLPSALASRLAELAPYLSAGDVRYLAVTDENFALVDRLAHWQAAVAMVSKSPLLGVGVGNYPAAYAQFAVPGWPDPLGHAHNYYLNVAAEAGLLGLAGYLILWVGIGGLAWRGLRLPRDGWRPLAIGTSAALAALAVHSVFDNLYVHGLNLQFALLLALLGGAARGNHG